VEIRLRSYEFRREREQTWSELERLVARVEKSGVRSLEAGELARLPLLYNATLSSLSVARTISLDRALLEYLESLCGRAYFAVYGTKQGFLEAVVEFFRFRFPATVRNNWGHLALAAFFLVLGAVTAGALVTRDVDWYYSFVNPAYAQGRDPDTPPEELREALYDTDHEGEELAAFSSQLFTHNAGVGMLAASLGVLAGIPVFLLLFYNGLILGAFLGLFHARGIGSDLWAWLLPHGVTELLAIVLCGAAGLIMAQALVFPGRHRRLDNIARRGREAGLIVVGCVLLFGIAAVIEGVFRQTVTNIAVRWTVVVATALWWTYYFGFVGRGRDA